MKNETPDDMKKQTRVYVLILLLLTAAAIAAGVIIYVLPVAKAVGRRIADTGTEIMTEKKGNLIRGNSGSWDPSEDGQIRRILIDADLINFHLQSGDAFHAEWDIADRLADVMIEERGDELVIRKKETSVIRIGLGSSLNPDSLKSDLFLTVPEDICLETLTIEIDCGNVAISGAASENTEIDAACGNIELKKSRLGSLHVAADCGNVDLDQVTASDAVLQADLGRVAVLEGDTGTLEISADCGQIECRRIRADRVELNADCGSIEAGGDFASLRAECDLGSISVETDRPEADVDLDLSASVGSVTVNGRKR